jgi:hypothetical protein
LSIRPAVGRWLYDYQYDQTMAVNTLPDLCETAASIDHDASKPKKLIPSVVVTGPCSHLRRSADGGGADLGKSQCAGNADGTGGA